MARRRPRAPKRTGTSTPTKKKPIWILPAAAVVTLLFVFAYQRMTRAAPATPAISAFYISCAATMWALLLLRQRLRRTKH